MTDAIPSRAARKVRGRMAQYTKLEKAIYDMLDTGRNGDDVRKTANEIIDEWYETQPFDEFCTCGHNIIELDGTVWRCSACKMPAMEMARGD